MAKKPTASTTVSPSKPSTAPVPQSEPHASAGTPGGPGSATVEATQAVAPSRPAKPVIQREIGNSVGADAPAGKPVAEVTHDMIAQAAYFLSQNGTPGSEEDHWRQAESDLRGK